MKGCASAGSTTRISSSLPAKIFQHIFPHERSDLSHWRKRLGEAGVAAGREPAGRSWGWRVTWPRPQAGHGRYHGATEGHHLSDRAKLLHVAIKGLNRLVRRHGVRLAAILFSRRQGRRDDGGPLRPCQTVQGGINGSSCTSCAAAWAGSSATSAARSRVSQLWRRCLHSL